VKVGDDLDAVPGRRRDEGWDETVFVWNGTVARIAVADLEPDSAGDVAGVEVKPRLILDRDVDRNAPTPCPSRSLLAATVQPSREGPQLMGHNKGSFVLRCEN
jgi:hypothetical protein